MNLTDEQNAALMAHIQADPSLNGLPQNNGSAQQIANALNADVSPQYFAWKTSLLRHDFTDKQYIGDDGVSVTTFVWGGSQGGYINRSQGERDAFREIFNSVEACYPKLANVRTAFDDIFSGSGAGAQANRAHFRAASRRTVKVWEKVLCIATTGGPSQSGNRGTRTNPDTLTQEGSLSYSDVNEILGWVV